MSWAVEVTGPNWSDVQQQLDEWKATKLSSNSHDQFRVANDAARNLFDSVAHPGVPCRVALSGNYDEETGLGEHVSVVVVVDRS